MSQIKWKNCAKSVMIYVKHMTTHASIDVDAMFKYVISVYLAGQRLKSMTNYSTNSRSGNVHKRSLKNHHLVFWMIARIFHVSHRLLTRSFRRWLLHSTTHQSMSFSEKLSHNNSINCQIYWWNSTLSIRKMFEIVQTKTVPIPDLSINHTLFQSK